MAKMGPGKRQTYEKPQNTKKTVFQLLHYVGRYKLSMVLVIVFLNAPNIAAVLGEDMLYKLQHNAVLFVAAYVGVQALIEAAVGCIISGSVCKVLKVALKK